MVSDLPFVRALYDFQEQSKAVVSANGVCEQNNVHN